MKLCQIYNIASHYRRNIYSLIDETFDCDLYTSKSNCDIKTMDLSKLRGNVHLVETKYFGSWSYQYGIPSLAFKNFDVYLVTGETRSFSTWLFLILTKILGKDVYLWTHGWYGKESGLNKIGNKLMLKLCKGVFLYGNYAKKLLKKEGFKPEKLHVLHNSLDYDTQLSLRHCGLKSEVFTDYFHNSNRVLIFIGRLTPVKQLDMLVEAVARLKDNGEKYNLVFVGDGSEKEKLQTLANDRDVAEQIWFYGACYDEQKTAQLIYNADLCVAPGNIGLTAIHVMMFGCPVITHNDFPYQMPEFEAIKENKTGNYFMRGNIESLMSCISDWFRINENHKEHVQQECFKEIDTQWTPQFQINIIESVFSKYGKTTSN